MRILIYTFCIIGLFGISCQSTSSSSEMRISIYAAASLNEVVQEFADSYQSENPQIDIQINVASSGTLARQIVQGAPADVFISAHPQWMDYVVKQGYVKRQEDLAGNELVMIGAPQTPQWTAPDLDALSEILQSSRLAMGDPQHVPAGIYGKQALESLGWYETIESSVLPTKDVRTALNMVALNEASLGIVYQTDVMKSDKVKVMMILPPRAYDPIVYQIGLIEENQVTQSFYQYIRAYDNRSIWENHGFIPISYK